VTSELQHGEHSLLDAAEHSTTQKGNVNAAENVAESARAAEPSTRARDEPESEPLKTQYIISSDSDEGEQNEEGYEDDSAADDYDDLSPG